MQGQTLSKIVYTFCFKEWRDFCLLNLIERIKYNLFLSFMLYTSSNQRLGECVRPKMESQVVAKEQGCWQTMPFNKPQMVR